MPEGERSRVLVAGAGYVGSALAAQLARAGTEVYALRRNPGRPSKRVKPIAADLTFPSTLVDLPEVDAIVYSAGPDGRSDEAYRAAYVDGLRHVLESPSVQRHPPRRLLMTSSTGVYSQASGEWVDESSPAEPVDFSGQRLIEGENIGPEHDIETVVVRLGGIYGPGRTGLLERVRRGEVTVPTEPRYTNRIHLTDCVGLLAHLLGLDSPEGLYLGVDDDPADRREVITWLAERTGAPPPAAAESEITRGNKRCRNARVRASGYELKLPSYREGYAELIESS